MFFNTNAFDPKRGFFGNPFGGPAGISGGISREIPGTPAGASGELPVFSGPGSDPGLGATPEAAPEDEDEQRWVSEVHRALSESEALLDSLANDPRTWSAPDQGTYLFEDPMLVEVRSKLLTELGKTPEERTREKLDRYYQSLGFKTDRKNIIPNIKLFLNEFTRSMAQGERYRSPEERAREEAQEEFKSIATPAQSMLTVAANAEKNRLMYQSRMETLKQRELEALRENDIKRAQAYQRLAYEQMRLQDTAARVPAYAARLGLDTMRTALIQQQLANAKITRGLGGEAGFILALNELPEEEREKVLQTLQRVKEAGRDPLRAVREARPRGPYIPIRGPDDTITAFFSPADNRIIMPPAPLTDRPDNDQKAVDRGNLIVVLTNLARAAKLNSDFLRNLQQSPVGPLRGTYARLASKYGFGGDDAASISQINALLRHSLRTMIYLMSGKAVSEREARDFEEIMPAVNIGSKDFEVKLATILSTIATFAQVRFRKSLEEIIAEEARISPQLAPELALVAEFVNRAKPLGMNLYMNWKQFAPGFAERNRALLENPALATEQSLEEKKADIKRRAKELNSK